MVSCKTSLTNPKYELENEAAETELTNKCGYGPKLVTEQLQVKLGNPSSWPQRPLHLIPNKNSHTRIIGVRYASEKEYLPWIKCVPINDGSEEEGKSLVVDFRSKCFVGTMLIRVKDINLPPKKNHCNTRKNYFKSRKRTFQNVIQGFFIKNYPMSSSMTGQLFHPTSKSPPSFLVKSAIMFFRVLSPQLDVKWGSDSIKFLSPLNSTAQSLHVSNKGDDCNFIEKWDLEEPSSDQADSVFNHHDISTISKKSSDSRIHRKHVFDTLTSQHKKSFCASTQPTFDTNKIYTFQFYQHLLDLNEYKLDVLGSKWDLTKYLHGQPIKIHAGCNDDVFWSFDLWHESLLCRD